MSIASPGIFTTAIISALLPVAALAAQPETGWHVFYDGGWRIQPSGAWIGPSTKSEKTAEGLHIMDPTRDPGSGRLYYYFWQVTPEEGATVEARTRTTAASELWGSVINVADGVHEEDVSFFPDHVALSYAKVSAPFDVAGAFHTYRIEFKAPDIRVYADNKLLLDGTGKFTTPVIDPKRNRIGFGASASTATSDAVWQMVRFRGGQADETKSVVMPKVAGLRVAMGDTVQIIPGATYQNMFRFANGMLQVGDRRSTDGGKTWTAGVAGPWVGALQLPDGEVLQLDYRTHKGDAEGWYSSALTRWDAEGKPLPTLRARLHVPDFVPMVDDDGSVRDGPWCDHAIIQLRDGSLLAACCGTFKEDKTPITSYGSLKAIKYRGWVCRSTDRGLTWEYLSTVTADPSLGTEGCNEMCLVRAPDGSLLCIFRTGGNRSMPSPLWQCRSTDEGKTWGKPEKVADRGVWPNVCLMKSGVLACCYGRPGNWLTFSLDSGKTWVGSFEFYSGQSTCYMAVTEVAPNKLFVVWDRVFFDDGGNESSGEFGTWFTVERTGK
jgi:BNR repeat-like domain/BNR/Asp-box repeat